jgi:DNA-binding SARP family transcriptional activator
MTAAPALRLCLLGSPVVLVNEQPVTFTRTKALALLAYLAVVRQPCRRETLMALLWPDYDDERARAALRRTLAAITETPVRPWLLADRQHIALESAQQTTDVEGFTAAAASAEALEKAIGLYRDRFLAGFTLADAAPFDEWQAAQAQRLEDRFFSLLDQLTGYYLQNRVTLAGIELTRRWLSIDPFHEVANERLMRFLALSNQPAAALQHFRQYAELLRQHLAAAPAPALKELAATIESGQMATPNGSARIQLLPPKPSLIVGRGPVLAELRRRLDHQAAEFLPEVVMQGWPGIGKTTVSAALAYDASLQQRYADGVMWLALGETPNIQALITHWCQMLRLNVSAEDSIETITSRLRAHFAQRAVLFILDDVWDVSHVQPFRVAGADCATLMTTRFNDVARALASRADAVYKIPLISDEDALALLYALAPGLRQHSPEMIQELIHDLEGLPLALQVAGRLLHMEAAMGWGIQELVAELRQGRRLLETQAPGDRHEVALQTSPTIAVLLQRSVDRLDAALQERFALLGVFAPKPATFTLDAVRAIWRDPQPQTAIRTLIDRGLLEPSGDGRFQMHALLVMHARSMFQE